MWFTEVDSNRIGRITPLGAIKEFPIPTAAADPNSIVTGSDKNLWFTESSASKVGRMTTKGIFTEFSLGSGTTPYAIVSGPDGNLWITDFQANKIWKMTTQGVATSFQIPTPQSVPGQIVTGPDHNMWFTEGDPNANNIGRLVIRTGTVQEYSIPTASSKSDGVAAGPDGNMWFGEEQTAKIGVFVRLVLAVSPSTLAFSGAGQSQTITVTEKAYRGSWTATTSDSNVATVSPGNSSNTFTVTAQGAGSCSITVQDTKNNSFVVGVTVE